MPIFLRFGDFCAYDNNDNDDNDNDNDNDNNDRTDYFTPCACVRGNYVGPIFTAVICIQSGWSRWK